MDFLYKERFFAIVSYEIINHSENFDILTIKDTTCDDHENCIVEVVKDGDHYKFSRALNDSAVNFEYYHKGNDYFTSKEMCFKQILQSKIDLTVELISDIDRCISSLEITRKRHMPVKYLTVDNWSYDNIFFDDMGRSVELVGKIEYKNGKFGFVVNWPDNYFDDLPNTINVSENGKLEYLYNDEYHQIFLAEKYLKNYNKNKDLSKSKEKMSELLKSKSQYDTSLKKYKEIMNIIETENCNYDRMMELYKNIYYNN